MSDAMPSLGFDVQGLISSVDDSIDGWYDRISVIEGQLAGDPCRYEIALSMEAKTLNGLRLRASTAEARVRELIDLAVSTALATRGESAGVVGVQTWPEYAINQGAVPLGPLAVLAGFLPGVGQAIYIQALRAWLPAGRPSASTSGSRWPRGSTGAAAACTVRRCGRPLISGWR